MPPSAEDTPLEPPRLAILVRVYVSNGASLAPPPEKLSAGLLAGFGFGLLAEELLDGVFAGFGFGLLAANVPVCLSLLAVSVNGVMITSLIKGLSSGNPGNNN